MNDLFNKKTVSNLIYNMFLNEELITFLLEKKTQDLRDLNQFVDDIEEQFIKISDINELVKCSEFTTELLNYLNNQNFNDKILITYLNSVLAKPGNTKLSLYFQNTADKYLKINEFFKQDLNRAELSEKIIQDIYNKSSFEIFINEKSKFYKCYNQIYINNNNNKNNGKNFDEIKELKDKALLRKKVGNNDKFDIICKDFADIVNKINNILLLLNEIYISLYI